MKPGAITLLSFLLINCNNKASSTQETPANNPPGENKSEPLSSSTSAGTIVGEWDQQYTCFDRNGNYKLEPEEKKPSNTKLGFNWFRFNADGSCLRDKDIQFKGTYSIQEKNSTKKLVIEGGDKLRYTIIELTEKELILGSDGAFIVFKRIK
jgi:Lipocalin-like domain